MNKATQPQRMLREKYTQKHTNTPSRKISAKEKKKKCDEGKIETIASQAVVMMHYIFRFLLIFLRFMFYSM